MCNQPDRIYNPQPRLETIKLFFRNIMSDILPSRSSNNMISLIRISVNVISKCCIIVTLNHKNKYIMNKAFPTKPNTDTCDITHNK